MDQNWFYLIEQASDMSKIKLSFIIYACCLNKRTKTINKLKNEQPSSHFFLTDPLSKFLDACTRRLFFRCERPHCSSLPKDRHIKTICLGVQKTIFCFCFSFCTRNEAGDPEGQKKVTKTAGPRGKEKKK